MHEGMFMLFMTKCIYLRTQESGRPSILPIMHLVSWFVCSHYHGAQCMIVKKVTRTFRLPRDKDDETNVMHE